MNDYEILVDRFSKELPIKEVNLRERTGDTGYFYKNTILIEKNLPIRDKKERLYEEYGHYKTTAGNILSQNTINNRKQEKKARIYGSLYAITLDNLIEAWKVGCKYYWECAEFLGFSTKYVFDTLQYIKEVHGINFVYDEYEFHFISDTSIEIKNKPVR